jgi:thioesterase domain-containing protein
LGEAPDKSIADMADRYVAELRAHAPGPYILGGFSGGSIIALEMAKRLQDLGEQVDCAVLFDGVPPGKAREGYPWNIHLLGHLLSKGPRAVGPYMKNGLKLSLRRLLHAGPSLIKPYLSARFVERLRQLTPAWVHWDAGAEDMDRTLGFGGRAAGIVALDEHFAQVSAQHPMSTYGVETIIIKADLVWPGHAHDYYWSGHLTGKLTLSTTPGDHNTIFHPENAEHLASVLAPLLEAYETPQEAPRSAEPAPAATTGEPDPEVETAPVRLRS